MHEATMDKIASENPKAHGTRCQTLYCKNRGLSKAARVFSGIDVLGRVDMEYIPVFAASCGWCHVNRT